MKFIMMIIIMIDLETKEKNFTKISYKKYLKENSHCMSVENFSNKRLGVV